MPLRQHRTSSPPRTHHRSFFLALALLPWLGACASAPADKAARAESAAHDDPIEPTNRQIFSFDQFIDKHAMKPVARTYRDYVPEFVQHRLHDFLANLQGPVIEINDQLQGNVTRGWTTFERFAVNTTVGGLGLFDVASDWDLPFHDADYGQTLGVWGIAEGPYVVLPFLGPSNARDAVGTGLGFVLDPLAFVGGANALYAGYARGAANAVDDRADQLDSLDALEADAIDFYARMRSAYRQHRALVVAQGIAGSDDVASSGSPGDATALVDP